MANKKVSQLTSKPSVLVTDLFPIADPTTGQLFKTTISALGTAIGSGVSSVNTLVGAVVLDTDDIQELVSPTNRWYTDTRSRAALSASSPLVYNSGTGAFSIPAATTSVNGYLTSTDWTTFNAKQVALSGTGFVKISGTTISYDNSSYLTTSDAASTYLALAGGTLIGALNGTSAIFSSSVTATAFIPSGATIPTNGMYLSAADTLNFATASTERMRITSSGEILIRGTLNPYTSANRGNITLNGTSSNIITFTNNTISQGYILHQAGTLAIYNETNGTIAFGTNNVERMRITSGGNVGIGTNAPTFATGTGLAVFATSTDSRIALKNTASGDTSTDGFQIVLTTALEAVIENRENGSMRFLTNASEAMRITAAGNVLIGKTTGTSKFAVVGLPTSSAGLASGDFYQSAGVVMIVP